MIDPEGLMMIEPKGQQEPPVFDRYTILAFVALKRAKRGARYRGFHTCACGVRSGSDALTVAGMVTNSLLVHYVRDHRSEVPQSELDKLLAFSSLRADLSLTGIRTCCKLLESSSDRIDEKSLASLNSIHEQLKHLTIAVRGKVKGA